MSKKNTATSGDKRAQWLENGAASLALDSELVAAERRLRDELELAERTLNERRGASDASVDAALANDVARAKEALDAFTIEVGKNPEGGLAYYERWQADRFRPHDRDQLLVEAAALVAHVKRGATHLAPMRDVALRAAMVEPCGADSCTRCARVIARARKAHELGANGRNGGPSAFADELVGGLAGVSSELIHKARRTVKGRAAR